MKYKNKDYQVRDGNCQKCKSFTPFSGNGRNICRLYELGKCPKGSQKEYEEPPSIAQMININCELGKENRRLKKCEIKYLALRKQMDAAHLLLDKLKVPAIIVDDTLCGNSVGERLRWYLKQEKRLEGSCICMDCGKVIKVTGQSNHLKVCLMSQRNKTKRT